MVGKENENIDDKGNISAYRKLFLQKQEILPKSTEIQAQMYNLWIWKMQ